MTSPHLPDDQSTLHARLRQLEDENSRYRDALLHLLDEVEGRSREDTMLEVEARTAALEQAQLELVTRLGMAAEYRDDQTGLHTQRVSDLSARLGAALGLPDDDLKLLRLAARLHDVGKIGVPTPCCSRRARSPVTNTGP